MFKLTCICNAMVPLGSGRLSKMEHNSGKELFKDRYFCHLHFYRHPWGSWIWQLGIAATPLHLAFKIKAREFPLPSQKRFCYPRERKHARGKSRSLAHRIRTRARFPGFGLRFFVFEFACADFPFALLKNMNNSLWLAFSVAFFACIFEFAQGSAIPEPGMFDSSK